MVFTDCERRRVSVIVAIEPKAHADVVQSFRLHKERLTVLKASFKRLQMLHEKQLLGLVLAALTNKVQYFLLLALDQDKCGRNEVFGSTQTQ